MAFCQECGKAQGEDAKFCMECGTPVSQTTGRGAGAAGTGLAPEYRSDLLANLPEGRVIDDRYEIKGKIGQGGFGVVYRVYDRKMDIDKALKVLFDSVVNDGDTMEKLRKEATTMVRLNHPNIIRVFDFQEQGPIKYIDMEYVDGMTLKELKLSFSKNKLSERKANLLGRQIAKGLAYAHSEKVIHRDIKPQNILVSRKSGVKIMDFGISETMQHSMSRVAHSEASGTLLYMAPEQIKGKDVGREADIYSFGALLYDLVSGKPPFYKGDISFQVLNEAPAKVAHVSDEFNTILMTCLAKEYTDRYRSFHDVYSALRTMGTSGAASSRSVPVNPVPDQPKAPEPAGPEPEQAGAKPIEMLPVPEIYPPDTATRPGWARPQCGSLLLALTIASILVCVVGLLDVKEPEVQADPVRPARLINSLGMESVYIEPGSFMMGSPSGEPGRFENEPLHRVDVSQGFYMQTTEVTQGQWRRVMGTNPSHFSDCGDDCPVEKVSWNDVQAFIATLNRMEHHGTWRLPTEAEWEYACRAGNDTLYARGKGLESMGWYRDNAEGRTHAVAQKKANAWGLYDMHGNVWEWCADKMAGNDPAAPENRVLRGGAWLSGAAYCRSAVRSEGAADSRLINLGFRLVFLPD